MKESPASGQQSGVLADSRGNRRAPEQAAPDTDHSQDTDHSEYTDYSEQENEAVVAKGSKKRHRFRNWRRQRPFIGAVLVILGGIELFFSSQLDTGNLQIQFGIEGLQATVIPIVLVLLGLLVTFKPTHHVFYGIIALVLAVYSLIGVNLGGFILGMLLATIGAILVVAWMGPRESKSDAEATDAQAPAAERRGDTESAGEEETT